MANEFVIKNGYFSQGNSNVTGSLRVSGSIGVVGSGSDVLSVYGSQGNLLVATDTFSGSLFTVTDISGYPILDITSDYYTSTIQMIGTASLTGSLSITENLEVKQNITASKALISSSGNEQLIVMGSGSDSWITGIYGSQGNLLTVTDTFSGSIFTVSDISGYPILDITSDYYTSSVFLPTLQSQSQQYIVAYNSQSGLLSYMSSSAVGGSGDLFPYTGSAEITGSLIISGGFKVYDTINDLKNINSDLRSLYDAGGADSINWDTRKLSDGTTDVLNWQNQILYDSSGFRSILWSDRLIKDSNGDTNIDYSAPGEITITSNVIPGGPYVDNTSSFNLGSPTTAWDKIYVSNNSLHFVSGSVSSSIGFNNGVISFNNATVSIPTGSTVQTASYALTASYIENGGAAGVSSLTVGTGLTGSSTTGDINLNLSATAYTTYANNTAATTTPSLVTFKEVGEQAMTATITWNNTAPSGTTNLRYRWFQIGNMVQYFFFFNYGTGGLNNSSITFDFPADMPTPTPPTGTGTAGTYIYRGHGLGQTSPTNPSTAVGSGFWGGGIRRDAGNTKYEFFFAVGTAIQARTFYHSGFYFV
jgi:hypothetical protein